MTATNDWEAVLDLLEKAVAKQRGYAGFWDWPDKEVKERGISASLLDVATDWPRMVPGSLRSRPRGMDPPDCTAESAEGGTWGIEVTELVDQQAVASAQHGTGRWAAWDATKLRERITARLAKKDTPATVKGGPYREYVLLLHSDEPILTEALVRKYLANVVFPTARLLTRAYLLLSYEPASQTTPLIRLDLAQGA